MKFSVQIEFDKTLDLYTNKTHVVIGRSIENCDLVIQHESISRKHCLVVHENGHFFITDLGSSNGVFIDGQKLTPNKKTAFLQSSELTLGKLNCVLKEGPKQDEETGSKILSTTHNHTGNFTSTIRLARLDLKEPPKLELVKKDISKRPRNPVTQKKQTKKIKATANSKIIGGLIFVAAFTLLFFFFY